MSKIKERLEDLYLRWHKGTIVVGFKDGSFSSMRIRNAWNITCEVNELLQWWEAMPPRDSEKVKIGEKSFKYEDIWYVRCPNRGRR